ncbi:hypothetical protein [Parendozoicomonas haliclonae]|uniref:TRAF-type zinc finger n=1 Tax=Parendozoicomonas haliclonae TaxID=1960125 RepID=A0A1X7AQC1_9GAMM|nr:hypothetical protein [Parendozoicomonas haliclonae]SMA50504.1 TRAF-type zinc finger [Parendozoicomonas haliclonae]
MDSPSRSSQALELPCTSALPNEPSPRRVMANGRYWQVTEGAPILCVVCRESVATTTTRCTDITHAVCQPCDDSILFPRQCSLCRSETIDENKHTTVQECLQALADQVTFRCTEKECLWQGQFRDIPRHVASCENHIYLCPNNHYGCKEKDTLSQLQEHVLACSYREENCTECGGTYALAFRENHQNVCEKLPLTYAITMQRKDWQNTFAQVQDGEIKNTLMPTLQSALSEENCVLYEKRCRYECGFIEGNSISLEAHLTICPESTAECGYKCGAFAKRKLLHEHYQHCDEAPVSCPRGCTTIQYKRIDILSGLHEIQCSNVLVPCTYCQDNYRRIELVHHEKNCQKRSLTCRHCKELILFSDKPGHLDHCSKAAPFTLAGYHYSVQEQSDGTVFQRTSENQISHICIPVASHVLLDWLCKNHIELSSLIGSDKNTFSFTLNSGTYSLSITPEGLHSTKNDDRRMLNIFLLTEKGAFFSNIFTVVGGHRNKTYTLNHTMNTIDDPLRKSLIKTLSKYGPHIRLYLILSCASYPTLFPNMKPPARYRTPKPQSSTKGNSPF